MNITKMATSAFHKAKFKLDQRSPELLVGAGIVGGIASAVLACRATLKVDDILEEHRYTVDKIHKASESEELAKEYSKDDAARDLTITYVKTGVKLVKLYAPALVLGAASVASILGGHNILRKRNIAIAAAYTAIDTSFKDYRKRVVERFGEEVDKELKYNLVKKKITETTTDEDGKEKKIKTYADIYEKGEQDEPYSAYAKFFDDSCSEWTEDPEYNLMFLRKQEKYANDLLDAQGYLFLNDVYKMCGFKPTKAGQVVGWIKNGDDGYVDFGIYDIRRPATRDFVNGYESVVIIDPNVDGVISDKFEAAML